MRPNIDPNGGYLVFPNAIIFHPFLSLEAKGLLAYIAAKPDDWAFCAKRMAQELNCSEGTIKKYRKTLENTLIDASDPDSGYILTKQREQSGYVRYFVNFPSVKFPPDKIGPDKICTINKVKRNSIKTLQSKDSPAGESLGDKPKPAASEKKRKNGGSSGTVIGESETMTDKEKKIMARARQWMRDNSEKADKMLEDCKREVRNRSESSSYVSPRDIERMARELRMKILIKRAMEN